MLTTVKAEVEVGGKVRLLEPLDVSKPTKAILTLLEENGNGSSVGNAKRMLEFLRSNRLPISARLTNDEIEAQIQETRDSWE
ncbi:MAG TPA: hypothetical protein PLR83_01730 [Pyrinomonadaceae bacterium]|nr:hypothetical protein [Pyrinomonadaceae bacterium]